jgi:hypothetical protein
MRLSDKLFTQFIKGYVKIVRILNLEPKLGSIDTKKSDSLKEKR